MAKLGRMGWTTIVGVSGIACTPARLPPTVSVVDRAAARSEFVDTPEVTVDAAPAADDLLVTFRAPDRGAASPFDARSMEPRVVMRGGEEVWIGEPDRVRQNWIDEHDYPVLYGTGCPLAVSFDGAPIDLAPTPAHAFDLRGRAACEETDWPSPATPWLVLDRDGNGTIDDGRELFGTGTRLPAGELAPDGFAALAPLDANADGRITAEDPQWADLRLWSDHDADRRSDPSELTTLDDAGILALPLEYERSPRCDERGNCEIERAPMQWRKAGDREPRVGALVDVHLRCR